MQQSFQQQNRELSYKQQKHRAPYKVDLQAYMAECEANYLRVQKLLPVNLDAVTYSVDLPFDSECLLSITVTEKCKYTTMIKLKKESSVDWLADCCFDLRVYHDARMVEVVGFQKHRRLAVKYAYPNQKMYQQDEKYQQHAFLSECLSYCLKYGLSAESIA